MVVEQSDIVVQARGGVELGGITCLFAASPPKLDLGRPDSGAGTDAEG